MIASINTLGIDSSLALIPLVSLAVGVAWMAIPALVSAGAALYSAIKNSGSSDEPLPRKVEVDAGPFQNIKPGGTDYYGSLAGAAQQRSMMAGDEARQRQVETYDLLNNIARGQNSAALAAAKSNIDATARSAAALAGQQMQGRFNPALARMAMYQAGQAAQNIGAQGNIAAMQERQNALAAMANLSQGQRGQDIQQALSAEQLAQLYAQLGQRDKEFIATGPMDLEKIRAQGNTAILGYRYGQLQADKNRSDNMMGGLMSAAGSLASMYGSSGGGGTSGGSGDLSGLGQSNPVSWDTGGGSSSGLGAASPWWK